MNKYRIGTDVPFQLSVDDGVEYLDLSNCTILNVAMYCDAQEAFAGSCTWQLNADDHTRLDCVYPGDRQVYTGIMRAVVVMVGADGGKKAYDLADFFEIVATTEEANATEDTVTSAVLSAWQLPMSTLSTIVEAAINATEAATESAIAEISYTASTEDDGINVLHIKQADGNEQDFNIKNGSQGSQGERGAQGIQGPQGEQGNTGSSVDYPFELVNNETTDDATKAHTAAGGKRLKDEIVQLGQEVTELENATDTIIDTIVTPSVNLFNKETITADRYVNKNDGTLATSSTGKAASDYIPIPAGATALYITHPYGSGTQGWALYNASKVYTHGNNSGRDVTLQDGDAYIRFTLDPADKDIEMVVVGGQSDVPPQYVPYGDTYSYKLKDNTVASENIADGAVTTDKLANGAVTAEKLAAGSISKDVVDFIEKVNHEPINLLNPATCQLGYIRSTDGVYRDSSATTDRYATDFISVDPTGLLSNASNPYGASGGWAVYDKDKQYVRGSSSGLDAYTYQEGDVYIRVTIKKDGLGSSLYIVRGNSTPAYTPYFTPFVTYKLDDEISVPRFDPALSLAGSLGTKGDGDTLANGTKTIGSFPQYLKHQFNLSASGKISAFEVLDIGVGQDTTNGAFLEVDDTNIYLCRYYQGNVHKAQTQAHGLTISDFINVSAYMDDGVLTGRIGTKAGAYNFTFNALGVLDAYGIPFVAASSGTSLTAFSFRAAGAEFRKPIWVIGDSYVSWYTQRWPVQLWDTLGVESFLLDGLAGAKSAVMLEELKKMLAYGTPKFLLWCCGMNDSLAEWSAAYDELSVLCESKGITLVLQTIPWPASGTKADINAAVKATGLRYLDGYAAVSSDDNGTWYTGFSDDGVHTNELGAKAMATRFLADFPEFLQ